MNCKKKFHGFIVSASVLILLILIAAEFSALRKDTHNNFDLSVKYQQIE